MWDFLKAFINKVFDGWKALPANFKYPTLIFIIVAVLLVLSQNNNLTSLILVTFAVFILLFPGLQEEISLRRAKKVNKYHRIQNILKELATSKVTSVKDISSVVQKILKEILKNLEGTPVKKDQIAGKLDRFEKTLNEFIQQLDGVTARTKEWKDAGTWLGEHQKQLVENAVSSALKENKWLEKYKREFEENIYEHLKWAIESLNNADKAEIRSPNTAILTRHKFTTEVHIYPNTLEAIKKEIDATNNELSPKAKETLLRLMGTIIREYK